MAACPRLAKMSRGSMRALPASGMIALRSRGTCGSEVVVDGPYKYPRSVNLVSCVTEDLWSRAK